MPLHSTYVRANISRVYFSRLQAAIDITCSKFAPVQKFLQVLFSRSTPTAKMKLARKCQERGTTKVMWSGSGERWIYNFSISFAVSSPGFWDCFNPNTSGWDMSIMQMAFICIMLISQPEVNWIRYRITSIKRQGVYFYPSIFTRRRLLGIIRGTFPRSFVLGILLTNSSWIDPRLINTTKNTNSKASFNLYTNFTPRQKFSLPVYYLLYKFRTYCDVTSWMFT